MSVARVLPWGIAVGAPLAALAALTGHQDHDYFWHLATGRLIATEGLPRSDPFSFTYAGGDWILHEWLGELALYLGADALGTAGLVAVWSGLLALTLVIMGIGIGRSGGRPVGTVAALALAGVAMVPYASLRPLMLSLVFFAVLIWLLLDARDGRTWPILALPPIFVLWANTHGFWSIGIGILAIFIGASWLGRTQVRADRVRLTVAGAVAGLGTFVTPYGVDNLLYPLRYVDSGDWGLANILEWQSPDFHEPAHWPLLGMILVMALLRGRIHHPWLELCAWLALAGSLYALRVTPIAAVLCGYAIALGLKQRLPASVPRPRGAALLDWGFAGVVAIASIVVLARASAADAVVNPALFPVEAVDILEDRDPDARVFADYAWGGYVIHRLSERGAAVFVDGRNDMYPQLVLEDYLTIRDAGDGVMGLVDAYGVTAILLRPDTALMRSGVATASWCRVHESELAVLLLRGPCEAASSLGQHLEDPY